jgi:hypothetical protein
MADLDLACLFPFQAILKAFATARGTSFAPAGEGELQDDILGLEHSATAMCYNASCEWTGSPGQSFPKLGEQMPDGGLELSRTSGLSVNERESSILVPCLAKVCAGISGGERIFLPRRESRVRCGYLSMNFAISIAIAPRGEETF